MSDWIDEARAFYAARPWVTELLAEPANIAEPLDVLERRWNVRRLLRTLMIAARTDDQFTVVAQHLAQAVADGDITYPQALKAIARLGAK